MDTDLITEKIVSNPSRTARAPFVRTAALNSVKKFLLL